MGNLKSLGQGQVFGVALVAAVIYFIGQMLFVAVPVSSTGSLQRAIYLLFFIHQSASGSLSAARPKCVP